MNRNKKFVNQTETNNASRGKAIWDSEIVSKFFNLFIVKVEERRYPETHFTKIGWKILVKNFL